MDLNFLKNLLQSLPASGDPTSNMLQASMSSMSPTAPPEQYPMSPMDPNKDQKTDLNSLLMPKMPELPQAEPAPEPAPEQAAPAPDISAPKPPMAKTYIPPAMANPSAPQVQEPAPMPAPAPEPPKEENYLDMLGKAQQEKQDQMRNIAMMEAGDRIGTAIAGQGHLQYEPGKFENLKSLASAPVENIMQKQKLKGEQTDQQLKEANVTKAKTQLADDKAKGDPNSDISKVSRAAVVGSLNKIGRKDLANSITPSMSSKQIEDVFGQNNLQNMVTQFDAQQNRKELATIKAGEKAEASKVKADASDTKRLDQANQKITASLASSRSSFGKMANINRSAEAIEALVKQQPLGQMDNRQIQELARSLDAMLSSGAATISGTSHLIPSNMSGDASKIQEYISGRPMGAGQAAFVKKMLDTVVREKQLARKQMKEESAKILSSYSDLAKKPGSADAWKLMLNKHQLPEDIFADESDQQDSSHPQFNVDQDALGAEMKRRGL